MTAAAPSCPPTWLWPLTSPSSTPRPPELSKGTHTTPHPKPSVPSAHPSSEGMSTPARPGVCSCLPACLSPRVHASRSLLLSQCRPLRLSGIQLAGSLLQEDLLSARAKFRTYSSLPCSPLNSSYSPSCKYPFAFPSPGRPCATWGRDADLSLCLTPEPHTVPAPCLLPSIC